MLYAESVGDQGQHLVATRELLRDDIVVDNLRETLHLHAEGKLGALAVGRFNLDLAIVFVDDSFANIESQANALLILLAGTAQLAEHLEEFDLIVLFDADASVLDGEADFAGLLLERSLNRDRALARKLQRIRNQINNDLLDPSLIRYDHIGYVVSVVDVELDPFGLHLDVEHVVDLLHQFLDHDLLLYLLKLAVLYQVHVQHVIHQVKQ